MIVLAILALKIAVVFYFIKYLDYAKGCLSKIALLVFMFIYIIINVLKNNAKGLKAAEIGEKIGLTRKEVNSIIYSNRGLFEKDGLFLQNIRLYC